MNRIRDIHDFWFEGVTDQMMIDRKKDPFRKWFIKDKNFDEEIRKNFEDDIEKAFRGEYKDWENSTRGRVALILLFDQFSRNIYRNTPRMFAYDPAALKIALRTVEEKSDDELHLIERVFVYMPFMHAEDPAIQELSLRCFEKNVQEALKSTPSNTFYFEYNLDFARRHQTIIQRFGRFPHRNVILGRVSTPEEEEFLKTKGSSF